MWQAPAACPVSRQRHAPVSARRPRPQHPGGACAGSARTAAQGRAPAQAFPLHARLQLDLVAVQHGRAGLLLPAVVHIRRRLARGALLRA